MFDTAVHAVSDTDSHYISPNKDDRLLVLELKWLCRGHVEIA
jgi:hypothetical protein